MFDVVSIGSATKDIFLFTGGANLKPGINSHFLEMPFDKKIEIKDVIYTTGGSATNSAASFAKFGKKVSVIAKIGNDGEAEFIKKDLEDRKIDTGHLIASNGRSQFSTILVPKKGEMVILTYRGLEKEIKPSELKLDFKSKWMYMGPLPYQDYTSLLDVTDYCETNDIKMVINPGSSELDCGIKRMEGLMKKVDVISMNDEEARRFVGFGNDIKNLIKLGSYAKKAAIITKGENGLLVFDGKYIYAADAFRTKQINFIGAGDSFLSGFINALIDDKGIEDAINLGSYNASKVIQQYGAKAGLIGNYPEKRVKIKKVVYGKKKY